MSKPTNYSVYPCAPGTAPDFDKMRAEAAEHRTSNPRDEFVDQLRVESKGYAACMGGEWMSALLEQAAVKIERMTAEVEALKHDIERHLSIATTYVNANQSLADKASEDAETITRLRAALENIVATESVDNDGEPVPETGACFLAKQALAGAAEVNAALNIGQHIGHAKREQDIPCTSAQESRAQPDETDGCP